MKKVLVFLLVALVVLALAACGDDPVETTKADTTTPAVTTQAPADTDPVANETTAGTTQAIPGDETPGDETPGDETPGDETPGDETPGDNAPFSQGIDILNGPLEYMAIDPLWNGVGCNFENHQPEFNYKWCFVFSMIPTEEYVQEELMSIPDYDGTKNLYGEVYSEDFTWTLYINGEEFVISHISVPVRDNFIYVRLGLGDWEPELGEHEYDVKLKIVSNDTNEIVYWAWFSDPMYWGSYVYNRVADPEKVEGQKPENVVALPDGSLEAMSGPDALATTETFVKAFDGLAKTKLCSSDYTNPLIFKVTNTDVTSIVGFAIVGANDDEKHPERVVVKFTLYGSDDGKDGSWNPILTKNESVDNIEVANYAERYFALDDAVEYTYFKLVIEDASGAETPKYQFSDILLYTEK